MFAPDSILIENLPFSRDALKFLSANEIKTLSDLLKFVANPENLQKCGTVLGKEVREITKPYLELASSHKSPVLDEALTETVIGRNLSFEEALRLFNLNPDELRVSGGFPTWIRKMSFKTALELARLPVAQIKAFPVIGSRKINEVRAALERAAKGKKPRASSSPGEARQNKAHSIKKIYFGRYKVSAEVAFDPSESVLGRPLSDREALVASKISIEELLLTTRALNWLKDAEITNAEQLAKTSTKSILSSTGVGSQMLQTLKTAVEQAMKFIELEGIKESPADQRETPKTTPQFDPTAAGFLALVDYLIALLASRQQQVIRSRYGIPKGPALTLEKIGEEMDLTRERVRQIEKKALERLNKIDARKALSNYLNSIRMEKLGDFFDKHEGFGTSNEVFEGLFGKSFGVAAGQQLLNDIFDAPWRELFEGLTRNNSAFFSSEEVKQLFERTASDLKGQLTAKGRPIDAAQLARTLSEMQHRKISKKFVERVALAHSDFRFDARRKLGLARWKFLAPKNIPEKIYRALLELGQPSHTSHIVHQLNLLFPQDAPFSENSVHAQLVANSDKFVRVRAGTYGLADWGLSKTPFIRQFLAETLRSWSGQARIEDLVAHGKARYGFKESSMVMTLYNHPRIFKILPNGMCKLI